MGGSLRGDRCSVTRVPQDQATDAAPANISRGETSGLKRTSLPIPCRALLGFGVPSCLYAVASHFAKQREFTQKARHEYFSGRKLDLVTDPAFCADPLPLLLGTRDTRPR